jgi:DnaJ-class molecular chaperone
MISCHKLCHLIIASCFLVSFQKSIFIHANNTNPISTSTRSNPYKALGVSKDATQDDIKKAYRTLCLKYHPDKNVNKSTSERQRNERLFKDVQEANSLIGTMDARQKYDALQASAFSSFQRYPSYDPFGHSAAFGYGTTTTTTQPPQSQRRRRTSFYVNGIDLSHLFTNPSTTTNHSPHDTTIPQYHPKSTFIQKVQIPLEELYTGVRRKPLHLQNTLWTRYRAAFRGGIATHIALQSFLTSLPLLFRTGPIVFIASFVLLFHLNVPHPRRTTFYVSIPKGWKHGTKLKFQNPIDGTYMDYIFVIDEGNHTRYTRVGDDLCITVSITRCMAKQGCTISIDPLDEQDEPIRIDLKPDEIDQKMQVVTVKKKGWPKSDGSSVGDLIVTVRVVSNRRRSVNTRRGFLGSRHNNGKTTRTKKKKGI